MKLISPDQLIELLPAEPGDIATAQARLDSSVVFRNQDRMREAVAEGWVHGEIITINGQKAYFVCWNKTFDGGLWLNVAQTLGTHANSPELFHGCEMLAHRERCSYVRFTTSRRALVRVAQSYGYKPDAVLMTKEIYG
jgi:hypothetical protein